MVDLSLLGRITVAVFAFLVVFPAVSLQGQAAPTDQQILDAFNAEAANYPVLDDAAWDQIAAALIQQFGVSNAALMARVLAENMPDSAAVIAAAMAGQATAIH